MIEIRYGVERGLDVTKYANPLLDCGQMSTIRKGLEDGVDVSLYNDPKYSMVEMEQIYQNLFRNKNNKDDENV